MNKHDIGFQTAVKIAMQNSQPIGIEPLPVMEAVGRICAEDISAAVNSPSVNAATKDGHAVRSSDITAACIDQPVRLDIIGSIAAGECQEEKISSGKTIRILTGAKVPDGADAVLAEEFSTKRDRVLLAQAAVRPGKNIFSTGSDVTRGEIIAVKGQLLMPSSISLLVAGGISTINVFKKPKIGLLATGSEVLLPGEPIINGKLYASNVALQTAWLQSLGFQSNVCLAKDSPEEISTQTKKILSHADVLITSGGTWKGDRDYMVKTLDDLGWELLFHRTRMGPGKAIGMGMLYNKPVFCLPGGPTSNEVGFIMIALPAILKMAGNRFSNFLTVYGKLDQTISGRKDWTQFIQCRIDHDRSGTIFTPIKIKSRIASIVKTQGILQLPEGVEEISKGSLVPCTCLDNRVFSASRS